MTEILNPDAEKTTATQRKRHDTILLTMACVAQVMVVLDVSVVTVALPSISHQLHYTPTGLQWVVNAYVLTFAGFLLLGGRGADLFGRRRAFLFGLGLFTLASLLCALAQNADWLTAARAAQGIGAAALSPATLTIIVTTFSGRSLAKGLGLWGAMGGVGGALGTILGGVLTNELGWRWVFYINIPLGIVAALGAVAYLTELRREGAEKLDVFGAFTVTVALAALVYAIVTTDTYAWGSAHTIGIAGGALVVLGIFLYSQTKKKNPLMPLSILKIRTVASSNTVMMIVGIVAFSMWYFLSLYLQDCLGFSALKTGFAFLPMAVLVGVGAQVASRALPRFGARPIVLVGTALLVGGFFWLSHVNGTGGYPNNALPGGTMTSFGLGILFTTLASAGTAGVDRSQAGLASGLLNAARQVGGSIGLAVLATIATSRTAHLLSSHTGAITALSKGYGRAFLVCSCVAIVAFLMALLIPHGVSKHQKEVKEVA